MKILLLPSHHIRPKPVRPTLITRRSRSSVSSSVTYGGRFNVLVQVDDVGNSSKGCNTMGARVRASRRVQRPEELRPPRNALRAVRYAPRGG